MLAERGRERGCLLPAGVAGGSCCSCAQGRRASPLACLTVCFLVLTYNLLGGFLFLALEGAAEEPGAGAVAASMPNLSRHGELRARTVERLWAITEDLNILYKENWTALAAQELVQFQRALLGSLRDTGRSGHLAFPGQSAQSRPRTRWTFATSFLYALTLITTIGQGEVAPRSPVGRLAAVAYACVGIPLVMLYLSTLGGALAHCIRALYWRRERPPPAPPDAERRTPFHAALNLTGLRGALPRECAAHARVPAPLGALLAAGYVALGTLLFRATERWTFVDGCFFSFSSLATIGFGDLRPGLHASAASARAEDLAVGACCAYILVGIVVVAMCFNLIQEDASSALRTLSTLCEGSKARAVHGTEHGCDEKVAMAMVS